MKEAVCNLFILLSFLTTGCGVKKDTFKINHRIYEDGRIFSYKYSIIQNGISKRIVPEKHELGMSVVSRGEYENYLFDTSADTVFIDTLIFYVSNFTTRKGRKIVDRGTTMLFYGQHFSRYFGEAKLTNDKNCLRLFPMEEIWYESGFMNCLQVCPPLMMTSQAEINSKWTYSYWISNQYSNKNWIEWNDSLQISAEYTVLSIDSISTVLGKTECLNVHGTSISKIGQSSLTYAFSNVYGFLSMDYEILDGTKFSMELVAVK